VTKKSEEVAFEEAVKRLEVILEKMNSGNISLDDSLKMFEEANQLIGSCQKRLAAAEQKVEKLIKTRQGELALDAGGQPQTESL